MADYRDVMHARHEADSALASADAYGGQIEDGREGDGALAALLAARAVCLELRALGMVINYEADRVRL
jgi:hypothetical protein